MVNRKRKIAIVKLQIKAGMANPAPPVGPALGVHGINIMKFCKEFNEKTKKNMGLIFPAIIIIYQDRSFDFFLKSPPTSILLKKELGISKGSSKPNIEKVGSINYEQLKKIALIKKNDLNVLNDSLKHAIKIVKGTAKSMGITIRK
jgi:large subunit ribosomal protein L11